MQAFFFPSSANVFFFQRRKLKVKRSKMMPIARRLSKSVNVERRKRKKLVKKRKLGIERETGTSGARRANN